MSPLDHLEGFIRPERLEDLRREHVYKGNDKGWGTQTSENVQWNNFYTEGIKVQDEKEKVAKDKSDKMKLSLRNSPIEDWGDDDDFMIDNDDLTFRSNSSTANQQSHHRDSHSSFRSDRESLPGNNERQLHLPGDDEKSTLDAIAAAAHAGIPIPTNVPPSALMGGTIKRLGGRKMKKIFQEDYGDDLELPLAGALRLKPQDDKSYPESLRQVSGSMGSSPVKRAVPAVAREPLEQLVPKRFAAPINLEKFRDTDDDDDVFGDGMATIKAPKLRSQSRPLSLITPPTPSPPKKREEDDLEGDLEIPTDGLLKLSRKMDIPKTPALSANDDFDWGDGSLGTRFGGTKRDAFSTRSSSVSALSPSLASSITAESEDELFDGLLLPNGPLDLGERLKRRKQDPSPEREPSQPAADKRASSSKTTVKPVADKDDLLDGLDFGDGDVFCSGKSTLHRNVKVKETRPVSPVRPKTAVSVTFTNKPVTTTPSSRLPRPMGSHERVQTQPSLEPVSESGGPILPRPSRRSQSRLGHSAQSSISSVHTPTTPSSVQSPLFTSTPRRRELMQKASTGALRNEPTTTNAQLLRLKRSLPAMRHNSASVKPTASRFDRPPSRTDSRVDSSRPQSVLRPKTPVDRSRPVPDGSVTQPRRVPPPFLPAGASQSQSQHVTAKTTRPFRRHDSDQGPEIRPLSRAVSRTTLRSPSPRRGRNNMAAEPIWQQINKPRRVRRFGDGHELDSFDDLPTSAQTESKFVKQPIASGNRTNIRNKIYQNVLLDRNTPSPVSPYSPARMDSQPHFARDTAASRIARETSLAQRVPPTAPVANQRVAQLSTRALNAPRLKKSQKIPQLKPHLISNLNSAKETRVVNGMTYNPATFRWEGNDNDNALNAFDVQASSPKIASLPPHMTRDREGSLSRPVLITNMTATKGVKRVGDMIFDPQNMCWLKADTTTPPLSNDPMDGFDALDDDDPFKDIPDLDDKDKDSNSGGHGRGSDVRDDWLVGEEFDVGPEFIRRQHEEESRWRRKCGGWTNSGTGERGNRNDQNDLRWELRRIIMNEPF